MLTPLRMAQLLAIALAGGALMGALAGMVFFAPAGIAIGGALGLVVGFVSLGVVAPALSRKSLPAGVLLIYPLPVLVAMLSGALGPDAAVPATGATLALCALAAHCLMPNTWPRVEPGHCPRCAHDVRAIPDRCPECGAPIRPERRPRRWSPLAVVWLALVSAMLLTLSVLAVPPALDRLTLGYATTDPDRLMKLMGDPEMTVHDRAARRLRKVAPQLLATRALAHPNHRTRIQAARMLRLGFENDPEALGALIRALNDPNDHVRYEAAVSLGFIANPDALASLRLVVSTDPSAMVVRGAAEAIEAIESGATTDEAPTHAPPPPPTSDR